MHVMKQFARANDGRPGGSFFLAYEDFGERFWRISPHLLAFLIFNFFIYTVEITHTHTQIHTHARARTYTHILHHITSHIQHTPEHRNSAKTDHSRRRQETHIIDRSYFTVAFESECSRCSPLTPVSRKQITDTIISYFLKLKPNGFTLL